MTSSRREKYDGSLLSFSGPFLGPSKNHRPNPPCGNAGAPCSPRADRKLTETALNLYGPCRGDFGTFSGLQGPLGATTGSSSELWPQRPPGKGRGAFSDFGVCDNGSRGAHLLLFSSVGVYDSCGAPGIHRERCLVPCLVPCRGLCRVPCRERETRRVPRGNSHTDLAISGCSGYSWREG